ncbi:ROK family protein [Candidatus Kaiserbacteria bacterium]|nr:ROK family protein [Candidatus Kaiserbacteria bacterium]
MYILLDVGGTKTRIAVTTDLASFSEPKIIDTPQEYEAALTAIADAATEVCAGTIPSIAMIGAPRPQNLPLWRGKDLARDIGAAVRASTSHLENDTALVGLGEATVGAGQGAAIFVYLTVSTGVGGVRIVNGHIDLSRQGFEPGGQYLTVGDSPKTLEGLVSGTAVTDRFGMHPRSIPLDNPIWEELARTLAIGVHNTILHWSPDTVVIGGSMMNEIGISIPRVTEHVKAMMQKFEYLPSIVHSTLTDQGGLWGGMARLRQLHPQA